jgi:hypothetical protein
MTIVGRDARSRREMRGMEMMMASFVESRDFPSIGLLAGKESGWMRFGKRNGPTRPEEGGLYTSKAKA